MTDSIDHTLDFGTPERRRHGVLKLEPRDLSNGGTVITTGLYAPETSVLDYLHKHGHLGVPQQADRRQSAGNALYDLFCKFGDTQPTKDIGTPGRGTAGDSLIMEGDIGDSADIAETIYHAVMSHPKMEFRHRMCRTICIEGALNWPCAVNLNPRYLEQVTDALDVLESVLMEIESLYKKHAF